MVAHCYSFVRIDIKKALEPSRAVAWKSNSWKLKFIRVYVLCDFVSFNAPQRWKCENSQLLNNRSNLIPLENAEERKLRSFLSFRKILSSDLYSLRCETTQFLWTYFRWKLPYTSHTRTFLKEREARIKHAEWGFSLFWLGYCQKKLFGFYTNINWEYIFETSSKGNKRV